MASNRQTGLLRLLLLLLCGATGGASAGGARRRGAAKPSINLLAVGPQRELPRGLSNCQHQLWSG